MQLEYRTLQSQRQRQHILCLATLFTACFFLIFSTPVLAKTTTPHQLFNTAYKSFHSLRKSKKAELRGEWYKVLRKFDSVVEQDASGIFIPKALYYQARVHEELGYHSGLKTDFKKAIQRFDKMVMEFPEHTWADDCLFRAAVLLQKRLGEKEEARDRLVRVIEEYPRSDMFKKAEPMLAKMGPAPKKKVKKKPAPVIPQEQPDASPENPGHLKFVRYLSSDDYTRVVLDLDAKVEYYYKFLDPIPEKNKGDRVYIDLKNVLIGDDIQSNVAISDGILRGYRVAQKDPSTTRVVLDLHEHQDHKVFHLNNPFRLVIDVYAPGNEAPPSEYDENFSAQNLQGVDPGDLVEVLGLRVRKVMIDPGHGGLDPGAQNNGIVEKNINLAAAKMLGKELKDRGFQVSYTRTEDIFVPLEDRAAMANMQKADLFISLHCNANRKRIIQGVETYSLGLRSSSAAAKRVAARENGVDTHQISDSQLILTELMLNSKMEESSDLAHLIQRKIVLQMPKKYHIQDHGRRRAPFYVLMGAKMPAVLVELGYTTNRTEAKYLKSQTYLKYLVQGIACGVDAYRKHIERFATE